MSVKGTQFRAQVDKLLTNVSNMYKPEGMVADKILTPLPVIQDSGILPSYGNSHLRLVNTRSGGRGRARLVQAIERDISKKYNIIPHELRGEVTEDDYRNVEAPYDAEKDETLGITSLISIEKEYNLASVLGDPSIITQNTNLTSGDIWSAYDTSNPVSDVKVAHETVREGCGMPANKAVMDWSVYNNLRYHPQVLENLGFKDNRAGTLTPQEIAMFLNVQEVHIAQALFNDANEGQDDDLKPIWGKGLVLLHAPNAAAKQQVSLGYNCHLRGGQRRVKKWQIEETFGNTGLLVGDNYSFEFVNTGAAYLIQNTIA